MVINVIIGAADEASNTIYNTTGAMKEMSISLSEVDGSSKATDFLTWTSKKLDSQAENIQTHATKNRLLIDKGLRMLYVITAVTISLSLALSMALLGSGVLKFQRILLVLIALCWTFTVLCWLFFGFYFFIQKFASDTCTALEGFQQDPYNNSLSSILPCEELLSANSVLTDVSAGIYDLVNKVNQNISTSYGNILQICNPFSSPPMYEYQPWNCSATSIQIGDIPRVLRMLACPDSQSTCNGGILVPTSYYKTIEAYSFSIQKLLDAYPGMESLVQCQTVKDAFSQILQKHCKPLKRYLEMLWEALVFLSIVLMVLVFVWTIGAHHEQNDHSIGGSVSPSSGHMLEFGRAKVTIDDSNQ
ncbi:hypothetical protein CDL12_14275 [Handroanthus impetiginosus]|uniref:Uncharacterized protein n=1 Tax=Handroanthus impetiginosus TaxID=429701 RepID=A0A2G9H6K0_9LAMI|nr:hypothetical protein CDL12_14275 [Handroanthus impetiginosus]